MNQCWLRCDICKKRRLVNRESLPALLDRDYRKTFSGTEPGYWEKWLGQADARYEEYVLDQISFEEVAVVTGSANQEDENNVGAARESEKLQGLGEETERLRQGRSPCAPQVPSLCIS